MEKTINLTSRQWELLSEIMESAETYARDIDESKGTEEEIHALSLALGSA